jgi:hypothetical protein
MTEVQRDAYTRLVGKPHGNAPLGRPTRRLAGNVKRNRRPAVMFGGGWNPQEIVSIDGFRYQP